MIVKQAMVPQETEGVFAVGKTAPHDDAKPRTDLIEPDEARLAMIAAVTRALQVYDDHYTWERAMQDGLDAGEEVLAKAVAEAEARAGA